MNHVLHGLAGTLLLATATLGSMSVSTPTFAAESYDNCTGFIDKVPATITKQGVWCLRQDVSTDIIEGKAIVVATNNVTIDCNNFKVGGLAAGTATASLGFYAESRFNTTIRNCNIRGFLHGVHLSGGGGHLVENNTLDGNTHAGVLVDGAADSTIRRNRVIGTGGSSPSLSLGAAMGIYASGADVIDNTVNGVAPTPNFSGNANAYGFLTRQNGEYSIVGNRIRGLVASGKGIARSIYNVFSGGIIVRDNDIQGSGVETSIGVHCDDASGTARDNVIAGFPLLAIENCAPSANTINLN